jgi:hypothetical protein
MNLLFKKPAKSAEITTTIMIVNSGKIEWALKNKEIAFKKSIIPPIIQNNADIYIKVF